MNEQNENFSKEGENISKNQTKFIELKNYNNWTEKLNSRVDLSKERINEFKDNAVGFIPKESMKL